MIERQRPGFMSTMTVTEPGLQVLQTAERGLQVLHMVGVIPKEVRVQVTHTEGQSYPEDPALQVPRGSLRIELHAPTLQAEKTFWSSVSALKETTPGLQIPPKRR